jgi:signal transduction histidine kinase/DNA-binding response OmpR family regulator/ligand-binding sensor domain-containing protein
MSPRYLFQLLIISILVLYNNSLVAQQHATFHQVGLLEEFSSYQTWCLFQDKRGLIWIGTEMGLDRWDGSSKKKYTYAPFDSLCIPAKRVYSIAEDGYNNLWLAVGRGLVKFDLEKETFESICSPNFPERLGALTYVKYDPSGFIWVGYAQGLLKYYPEKDSIIQVRCLDPDVDFEYKDFRVQSIEVDTLGVTWVAGNSGLYYFDCINKVFVPQIFNHKDIPLGRLYVSDMSSDPDGNIWMLDDRSELMRFNPYTRKIEFIYPKEFSPSTQLHDGGIQVDHNGKVWFGKYRGLTCYDPETGITTHLESEVSSSAISDIIEDTQGNIFVSAYSGVKVLNREDTQIRVISFFGDYYRKIGLITEVLRDDNHYWFGTTAAGIIQQNIGTGTKKYFRAGNQPGDLPSDYIYRIMKDRTGKIWVMAGEELCLFHNDSETFKTFEIGSSHFITTDKEGFFWICETEGMVRFDPVTKDTLRYNYDRSLPVLMALFDKVPFIRDSEGIFWLGGMNGLYRIDVEHGSWTDYTHDANNPSGLPDDIILCMYCDTKERVWAGTFEGLSLITYDEAGSQLTCKNFFLGQGELGRRITDIAEDGVGNIWVSTYLGAYIIKPNGSIESYSYKDGLPEQYRVIWTMNDDPDGSIYVGNDQVYCIPQGFVKENHFFPPVLFTGFSIFGEEVRLGNGAPIEKSIMFTDRIDLRYDQNFIRLDFASLNYNEPHRNQFRYFLDGIDPDTVESKKKNYAEYSNLGPGKYRFWVTGSNNTGIWNPNGISLLIRVHPPWFKSMAAIITYILLLVLGIVVYVRYSTLRLQREKIILEEEVKQRTMEINEKNRQITELDQVKSRFYDNISHELRTPLTLIAGPVNDLLKSNSRSKDQESQLLSMVKRNAQRLHQLINQLLEISKLETGSMKLEISEGDLSGFLRTIAISYLSLAEKSRIRYKVEVEKSSEPIFFDQDKIEKIASNLISNALKYTPEGGSVRVSLIYLSSPPKGQITQAKFLVSDTGPGIPVEEREKVFDRFYQVTGHEGMYTEGTGIGLALTKEIVVRYGGEIKLESEIGKGSTFSVLLPVSRDSFREDEIKEVDLVSEFDPFIETNHSSAEGLECPLGTDLLREFEKDNPQILVVEDNADLRAYILKSLAQDFQIFEASNGAEGLEKARVIIPELVITDLIMPLMDGMEMCRSLKQDERTSHIPVIMLTAKADQETKLESLETGADDYLVKPFDSSELIIRVKNLIEQRNRLRKKFSREFFLKDPFKEVKNTDESFLEKVSEIIKDHLADADFSVESFSRLAGMSSSQLYRKLNAIAGLSPSQFIRNLRLKHSLVLLRNENGNIAQIAYKVGFNDHAYFSKCFRELYGITPSEYVAGHQNKQAITNLFVDGTS